MDLSVLYEDNHLLAVAKPAGLLSQSAEAGDDNLVERAREYLRVKYDKPGNVYVGLVHRLDRNVSGVVLLARTSKAAARLTKAFKERRVDKQYLAVVVGRPPERATLEHRLAKKAEGRGVVEDRREGKLARLSFERLAASHGRALLLVTLETGRKHQIRAQLALAGYAVLGDPLYGHPDRLLRRPALHAARLALEHPVRREPLEIMSKPPADLARLLAGLGFDTALPQGFSGRD